MKESKLIATSKLDDSPNHTECLESSFASHYLYQASLGEIPCVLGLLHPEKEEVFIY